jgi:hypothetical protein
MKFNFNTVTNNGYEFSYATIKDVTHASDFHGVFDLADSSNGTMTASSIDYMVFDGTGGSSGGSSRASIYCRYYGKPSSFTNNS